jgi:hypothetical protein
MRRMGFWRAGLAALTVLTALPAIAAPLIPNAPNGAGQVVPVQYYGEHWDRGRHQGWERGRHDGWHHHRRCRVVVERHWSQWRGGWVYERVRRCW